MDNNKELVLEFRKATASDNLEEIAELIYYTDQYIYPYWFENIEKCKKELPLLMVQENFFFNVNNLYIAIDIENNKKIIGVICILDKSVDLTYNYEELRKINDRYCFTIDNYVMGLIDEVKNSDFAYISNVCVSPLYRGKHVGIRLMNYVIDVYVDKYFKEIALDVLAQNPGAIKLYENLGFEQISELFKGFSDPKIDKPDVFSMKLSLEKYSDKNNN